MHATDALDNLAFDATRNYTTWMHKVHQSGLQTATALVPHAEVRQNFQRYCDSFVSLPKTYETRRVYPDSDTCWMAGDVVRWHSPSASDDHTPSLTKLCNIRDLYRLEDSPTDAPDITGACSLSGLVEIEVLDLNGSNWTRHVPLCLSVLSFRSIFSLLFEGTCLKMRNKLHMSATWEVKVTYSLQSLATVKFGRSLTRNYHRFLGNSMSPWMSWP